MIPSNWLFGIVSRHWMVTAVINVSSLSLLSILFLFFLFYFLFFFPFISFLFLKKKDTPLWVISICATYTKGKKTSLQFGPPFKHTNFLKPMPCLAQTSASHHLHLSPFPTNGAGCSDAAGVWPTRSYTDREATHSSGSRRPPWKPSIPTTALNSNLICSGYLLKTITRCHRCFLAMWWGTSVTPGNASGGVVWGGK